mgnify:CR=1 FL=1
MKQDTEFGNILERFLDDYMIKLSDGGSIRKPNFESAIKSYKPTKREIKLLRDHFIEVRGEITGAINKTDEDLEHEVLYGQSFDVPDDDDWIVPIGKANILRSGSDVTIVAFSIMVGRALEAADRLAEQGISAEVIDLRSIRPLDSATIVESVKKTSRLVTCEEGFPFAGIGAEIAMQVMEQAFDWLDAPITRVTGKDVPMPYAANLEALALPQIDDIVAAARTTCDGFKG